MMKYIFLFLSFLLVGCDKPNDMLGKQAPTLKVIAVDQEPFEYDFSKVNKPHVVVFWSSKCKGCLHELKHIRELQKKMQHKFALINLNVDTPPEIIQELFKEQEIDLPIWMDALKINLESYQVVAFPTIVIIDKQGKVKAKQIGMHDTKIITEL